MDDSEPRPDDLAEALRAAFGGEAEPPSSVLRRLQQRTGARLGLHLHEADETAGPPIRIDEAARSLRDPSGRYQVLGEIGRGGVGIVYQGRDQDLGRDVAMKVLRAEYAARPEILERFVEEAQIGGQLQHPGIVPVYELGLQHGERPYFAMKLVKGETLAAQLGRRNDPADDRRRFLGVFEQVCQTLAYAHARRVVHRDLKPANVMIGSFGEVQVVDWGFAKVLPRDEVDAVVKDRSASSVASVIRTVRSNPETGTHSVVGSMLGTPAYMPPEQALGDVEHMDQRSDVFGLGAMLCEILTGRPPYLAADGDLIQQAARADLQRAFERIEQSSADAALVTLCKQCLSPARQARPASGKQVAEAIGQYLHSVEERAQQAQIRAAEARVRARATIWLAAGAVLVLALGAGSYLFLEQQAQVRRGQASQRVAQASADANVRLGEAGTAQDLGSWTRALDAASQAETLAADADVALEQRGAVAALLATIRDGRARAAAAAARVAKDDAMRRRLLEVRIPSDEDHDPVGQELRQARRNDHAYAAAFRDHLDGRELTEMTALAGASALAGDMAVELAAALDHWVFERQSLVRGNAAEPPDTAVTARLQAIAIALDPDPWRNRLRSVCAQQTADKGSLVRLKDEADLRSLPAVSLQLLASALVDAGAHADARAVYRTAYESHPTDFGCMFALGRQYSQMRDYRWALACFRIARALRPEVREVRHAVGMALEALGDPAALTVFHELAQEEPDNGHWQFHLGTNSLIAGKPDEALAFCRRSIELDPDYVIAHTSLAVALQRQQRFDEAIAAYRHAIELDLARSHAHTGLGEVLLHLGRLDEALAASRRAVELDENDAHAHYGLGASLAALRKREEAVAAFRRATELDPKLAKAWLDLGATLTQLRRFDEAIAACRRAVELDAKNHMTHHNLGAAFANHGKLDEAVANYRRALDVNPKALLTLENLGLTLAQLGRADEAVASYRQLVELAPAAAAAHVALADGLVRQRQFAEAVVCLGRAIELEPENAKAHGKLGFALRELRRLDEAIASCRRAIAFDPDLAAAWRTLAHSLREQHETAPAITAYQRAIELEPQIATLHFGLGTCLQVQKETSAAVACYRRATELDAAYAPAHEFLARLLLEQGKAEEAVACWRRAVELEPASATAHYNLASVLHRLDQLDEAIESLHRARALWSARDTAEAKEWLPKVEASIRMLQGERASRQGFLALARGERTTGSKDDFTAAADLVYGRSEYLLAVRTYERAVAAFAAVADEYPHRYNAACAAALAGCGKGTATAASKEEERAALRGQARGWLAAELARWRTGLAGASAAETARQLAHALQDPDFDGVRGEAALAALPAGEAAAWRELWRDLERALAKEPGR